MICLPSDDQVASAASTGSAERRPDSVSRMFGSARPVFSSTSTKSSSAVPAGLQRGSRGTSPCGQPQGDGSNGRGNWATKLVTPVERSYVMTCVSSRRINVTASPVPPACQCAPVIVSANGMRPPGTSRAFATSISPTPSLNCATKSDPSGDHSGEVDE